MLNMSGSAPATVPVKVRVPKLMFTLEVIVASEAGRSGVLKYSYSVIVTCSRVWPSGLVSKS